MKLILFTFFAVNLAFSFDHAKVLKRIDETRARSLVVEYLKTVGKSPDDYKVKLKPFGKSTWLIDCDNKYRKPSTPWRYVMNSKGEVKKLTLDSLNIVFLNEFPSSPKEEDLRKVIKDFTILHSGERISIIGKTSDIPSYDKAPLDKDIAAALRASFSSGKYIRVVYTYQQIGGIVRRYRFTFGNDTAFRKVECAVVGRNIGEAQSNE